MSAEAVRAGTAAIPLSVLKKLEEEANAPKKTEEQIKRENLSEEVEKKSEPMGKRIQKEYYSTPPKNEKETRGPKGKQESFVYGLVNGINDDINQRRWGSLIFKAGLAYMGINLVKGLMKSAKGVGSWLTEKIMGKKADTAKKIMKTLLAGTALSGVAGGLYNAIKGKIPMSEVTEALKTGGVTGLTTLLLKKSADGVITIPKDLMGKLKDIPVVGGILSKITGDAKGKLGDLKGKVEEVKKEVHEEIKGEYEFMDKHINFSKRKAEIQGICQKYNIQAPDWFSGLSAKAFFAKLIDVTGLSPKDNSWKDYGTLAGFIGLIYKFGGKTHAARMSLLKRNAGFYLLCVSKGKDSVGGKLFNYAGKQFNTLRDNLVAKSQKSKVLGFIMPDFLSKLEFDKLSDDFFEFMQEHRIIAMGAFNLAWLSKGFAYTLLKKGLTSGANIVGWGVKNPLECLVGAVGVYTQRRKIVRGLAELFFDDQKEKDAFIKQAGEYMGVDMDEPEYTQEAVGTAIYEGTVGSVPRDFFGVALDVAKTLKGEGKTNTLEAIQNADLYNKNAFQYVEAIGAAIAKDGLPMVAYVTGGILVASLYVGGKWIVVKPLMGMKDAFFNLCNGDLKGAFNSIVKGTMPIMVTAAGLKMIRGHGVVKSIVDASKVNLPRYALMHQGHIDVEMAIRRAIAPMKHFTTPFSSRARLISKAHYYAKKAAYFEQRGIPGPYRRARKALIATMEDLHNRFPGEDSINKVKRIGHSKETIKMKLTTDGKLASSSADDLINQATDDWYRSRTWTERIGDRMAKIGRMKYSKDIVRHLKSVEGLNEPELFKALRKASNSDEVIAAFRNHPKGIKLLVDTSVKMNQLDRLALIASNMSKSDDIAELTRLIQKTDKIDDFMASIRTIESGKGVSPSSLRALTEVRKVIIVDKLKTFQGLKPELFEALSKANNTDEMFAAVKSHKATEQFLKAAMESKQMDQVLTFTSKIEKIDDYDEVFNILKKSDKLDEFMLTMKQMESAPGVTGAKLSQYVKIQKGFILNNLKGLEGVDDALLASIKSADKMDDVYAALKGNKVAMDSFVKSSMQMQRMDHIVRCATHVDDIDDYMRMVGANGADKIDDFMGTLSNLEKTKNLSKVEVTKVVGIRKAFILNNLGSLKGNSSLINAIKAANNMDEIYAAYSTHSNVAQFIKMSSKMKQMHVVLEMAQHADKADDILGAIRTADKVDEFVMSMASFQKSGKATLPAMNNMAKMRNSLGVSKEAYKTALQSADKIDDLSTMGRFMSSKPMMIVGKGLRGGMIGFSVIYGGYEMYAGGAKIHEGWHDQNRAKGRMTMAEGGVDMTTGATTIASGAFDAAAWARGAAFNPVGILITINVQLYGNMIKGGIASAKEAAMKSHEWAQSRTRSHLVHELITTTDQLSAGDSYRAAMPWTDSVEKIRGEKEGTRKKLFEALLLKEYGYPLPENQKKEFELRMKYIQNRTFSYISQSYNETFQIINRSRMYAKLYTEASKAKSLGQPYTVKNRHGKDVDLLKILESPNLGTVWNLISAFEYQAQKQVETFLTHDFREDGSSVYNEGRARRFENFKTIDNDVLSTQYLKIGIYCAKNAKRMQKSPNASDKKIMQLNADLTFYLKGYVNVYLPVPTQEEFNTMKIKESELLFFADKTLGEKVDNKKMQQEILSIDNDPIVYAVYEVAKMFGYAGEANAASLRKYFPESEKDTKGIYWNGDQWVVNEVGWELDNKCGNSGEKTVKNMIEEIDYQPDDILAYRHSSTLGDLWHGSAAEESLKYVAQNMSRALQRGLDKYKAANK